MQEEFETEKEFRLKYPSKIYICPRCGALTTDPQICTHCQNQSNSFLFTDNFTYKINGKIHTIFKPIELLKGEKK